MVEGCWCRMGKKYSIKEVNKSIKNADDNIVEHSKRMNKENKTFHLANVQENLPLCAKNNVQKKWYRLWGWICWPSKVNCKKCIALSQDVA